MEIDEIKKLVFKINGWLTDKEGELLYNLAKNCTGKGVIVEIGSWKGKSTIWLGKGSKAGKKLRFMQLIHILDLLNIKKCMARFGLLKNLKRILKMQKLTI
jgi:hypothetical protein